MREIGALEAKKKLDTLLDWVEQGEELVITRRGKAGRPHCPIPRFDAIARLRQRAPRHPFDSAAA